ncbi:transcriptional regulator [Serinibacter arcticus]|uniref:Transcriptional regulator n=1 Tax=Serinibacter arcticus TaxID=1655435 RepID=A0A2U1ZUT4_9MICO|nr:helix-turn-helix transcriptional regulator [Serinibacter arcticus]PWD50745.1 transcriptional regulator [Serinibacter arcticus]
MVSSRAYDAPVLTVSAAAELAGMHAQTLRQYDRLGLVVPHRTAGRGRRYSLRDVAALREVQRLSTEGVNLEGIGRILELQRENAALRAALEGLRAVIDPGSRVFAASTTGDVESVPRGRRVPQRTTAAGTSSGSGALVLWRGGR